MRPEVARCSRLIFLLAALGSFAWHGAQVMQKQAATGCTITDLMGGRANTERCLDDLLLFGSRRGAFILCIVCLGINIFLSLTAVLLLIWKQWPVLRLCCRAFREKWASGVAFGKDLRHRIRRHFDVKGEQDLEAASFQREIERQRFFQAKRMLNMIRALIVPVLMFSTYATSDRFFSARSDGDIDVTAVLYLCHGVGVPLGFVMGVVTIPVMVPSCLTLDGLDCANVFLSGVWAWKAAVATDLYYDWQCVWIFPCRAIQGLACGNARLTIILNAVVSAIGFVFNLYREPETSDPIFLRGRWVRDGFILLLISALAWTFEHIQIAEAKATTRAQHSDHSFTLAHQVLSCMCDAVVRLDAKLCLTKPSPQLSSLLLRGGPISVGARFTNLMPLEDAERLRDCLDRCVCSGCEKGSMEQDSRDIQGAGPSSGLAGLCHINLKDGANSMLPAALFYGCALDVEGQPSYLIGIQEDRECQRYPAATDRLGPPNTDGDQLATLPEGSRPEPTVCSSSFESFTGNGDDGECPYLWVNAGSSSLPVLDCSSGFALLGGPASACNALRKCLSAPDLDKVRTWLADQPALGPCKVQLQPVGAEWRYACSLSVDSSHSPPPLSSSAIPVCLAINDLRMMCGKRRPERLAGDIVNKRRSRQGHLKPSQSSEDDEGLNVVVSLSSGNIHRVTGGCTQHQRWFQKHDSLFDRLERPDTFQASLLEAIEKAASFEGDESLLPEMNLGSFVFRQPGSEEPPSSLIGDIVLVDATGVSDYLLLRIGNLQDFDQPAV